MGKRSVVEDSREVEGLTQVMPKSFEVGNGWLGEGIEESDMKSGNHLLRH